MTTSPRSLTRPGLLRRVAAVATALPLAGAALLLAAQPAAAEIRQPADGAVYTGYNEINIEASYPSSRGMETLRVVDPAGTVVAVATQEGGWNGGTLQYTLKLGCWTPQQCLPGPNGTWTVKQEGSTTDTSTFVTRIAPEAPADVRAQALSPREAQVLWRVGPETDLKVYEVYEGSSVVQTLSRDACEGSTCSAVVAYASPGSGEHTYTVKAKRANPADGENATIDSAMSAAATVRLEEPPPAPANPDSGGDSGAQPGSSPTKTPTGGAKGGGAPRTGAGTAEDPASGPAPIGTAAPAAGESADAKAVAQRKAFALGFSAFGPKLGIPKLPPLPQAQPPAIAPELADGTYEPTLGFEDQVVRERVEVAQGPTERVRTVVGTALDSERLATSTAAALVLLLAGAHLRRWLGTASEE